MFCEELFIALSVLCIRIYVYIYTSGGGGLLNLEWTRGAIIVLEPSDLGPD